MDADRWRRVKALVDAAASREGRERATFLDEACSGDVALRREAEALLARASEAENFLAAPAWRLPALAPGARLGPHEIVSFIGAGGMGEVYKARDTRLDRIVAIKVLPPVLASDPERRQRFEREAKSISALNHPHICTLYDIGEVEVPSPDQNVGAGLSRPVRVSYLVMEYLEGETLAERLRHGALPLPQALDCGTQIADALAAAHKQGVIHRDLKPSNVMLTKSGAKLLDFGLAKLRAHGERPVVEMAASVTGSESLTARGVIVGTLPYMAPEQLEGKPADARTDLWALGAMLYEMLMGRRAFEEDNAASVVAGILWRDPEPLVVRQKLTPPTLERLVRRCLAKAPEERWQSALDLGIELRWLTEPNQAGGAGDTAEHRAAPAAWVRERVAWVIAVLGVAGAVVFAVWQPPVLPVMSKTSMRLTISLPSNMPLAPAGRMWVAHDRPALSLSPDATHLAYVALIADETHIAVRNMLTGEVTPLGDTVGGHTPFFSPDGAWIGFFADGKLKKVSPSGGGVSVLADAPNPWGAVWGPDNMIYFNRQEGEGLFRVGPDGGPVQPVLEGQGWMPGLVGDAPGLIVSTDKVRYVVPGNPSATKVVADAEAGWYVASGHLLYLSNGRLLAVPFDASRMEAAGQSVTIADDLRTADFGIAQFTVSEEGTLVYAVGGPQDTSSFVWVDRRGNTEPVGLPPDRYQSYALSPDNDQLAYSLRGDIYVYDRSTHTNRRITPRVATGDPVRNQYPRWTPDGTGVLYQQRGSRRRLMVVPIDGSAPPRELWSATSGDPVALYPMGFSPDGQTLSAFGVCRRTSFDLFLMHAIQRDGLMSWSEPERFLAGRFGEVFGQISPDGRWMLFGSDRSGVFEVYVTSYPKAGRIHRISTNGGLDALWNPAAPEIVYLSGFRMYAVDVTLGPELHVGEPRLLFQGAFPDRMGFNFDITRDGRHFLMVENKEILMPARQLTVVTNFFDELRRLAPADGR